MAKGDHSRAQNKIDEQQQMAQSYLTSVQGQLGNQYGNLNTSYLGQNSPTYGSVNNWGSTIPSYNPYGSGNPGANNPYGGGTSAGGGGQWSQDVFNQLFPGDSLSPQQLEAAAPQLAQYGIKVHKNAEGVAGKLQMPDGSFVDVIGGAGSGQNKKQYLTGGGGFGGGGGVLGMNLQDYGKISSMFEGMLPKYDSLYGDLKSGYGSMIGAASNMANTGGLSDQDKADMRSRAMSPVRSQYELATQNLSRNRALQGGYSPGYTTALGRFNRQEGQGISDAVTNADAGIAELVQRGKLGGLSAWGSGLNGMSSGLLGALGGENQSLGGMAGLYGTTPGLSSMLGNQMLQASGQQLTASGLQNQLGLGIMNAQNQSSFVPGNFQSAMGNIGSAMGILQKGAGMIGGGSYPWLKPNYDPNQPPGPNNDPGRPRMDPNNPNLIDGGYQPPIPGEIYGGNGGNPYGSGGYGGDPNYGSNPSNPYIPGPYMPYDPNNPGYQL